MKLLDLTLENFMPYKGVQKVVFPHDDHRNVMIVWGNNMRGKTSFLNALRWAFYGEALDRNRNPMLLRLLANVDAISEGDHSFSVFVRFVDGGTTYDLRRSAKPKSHVTLPKSDHDFDVHLSLSANNEVVPGHLVSRELTRIFPKDVSRFFLFDAELLLEYEDLLVEGSVEGKRIRKAIEQVLGVPPLVNGKRMFATLLKQAQVVLAKENEHTKGMEALSAQFKVLEEELEALKAERIGIKAKDQASRSEIARIEGELGKTEAAQLAQGQLDSLLAELKSLGQSRTRARETELVVAADAWRDLLQPRLQVKLAALNEEMARHNAEIEHIGALKQRVRQLKHLLARAVCEVCGQEMQPARRDAYGSELGTLEIDLGVLQTKMPEIAHVSSAITRLSRLQGTGAAARLASLEAELGRIAIKMTEVENHIDALQKEVAGFDSAEAARLRSQHKQLMYHSGLIAKEITDLDAQITLRTNKQNDIAKLMSKAASARTKRSSNEVALYGALADLFGGTIDELRDRLRKKVAEAASAAFARLSSDTTYEGLQINESYGLTIIDRLGRPVEVRSAGAEQIVAMALIDGLNHTAGRGAPIVIDTPLSRLDLKHRANVLAYVPEMAGQVVLLVHEGEIAKSGGLAPFADRVGAVYEIERISSSQSRLNKL